MKNKITKVMAVVAMLGLMAAGPVAYAEYGEGGPEGGKGWKHGDGQEFFKGLNLTPEQKEKLKAQRETKKEGNKAAREQLKAKMQALHEEIAKPGTTRADVNGLVGEVTALKGQMFAERIDGVFAMKEVLTPEQFAKMQEHRKEKMENKKGGWGRHQKKQGQEQE